LARGKAKAYRIACVSNIGNVFKAGLMFGQDNGERLPWQLTRTRVIEHIQASPGNYPYGQINKVGLGTGGSTELSNEVFATNLSLMAGNCFSIAAMKVELVTPTILLSPCDAARKAANIVLQGKWEDINTKVDGGSKIATVAEGASYCLVRGADTLRPDSIYSITRNWSSMETAWASGFLASIPAAGGSLSESGSSWVGNDDANATTSSRVVAGLSSSTGQLVLMDGSARQSVGSDLGASGTFTKAAYKATGGLSQGKTSMAVIRGTGLD
ncbi:MAG: hypothetical protein VB855_02885, partial [Pirellulaceae bacterium]